MQDSSFTRKPLAVAVAVAVGTAFTTPMTAVAQEGEVIERIRREMLDIGYDEVTVDPMGNLIGRIGAGEKIIAFDGHVDVVDVGDPKLCPSGSNCTAPTSVVPAGAAAGSSAGSRIGVTVITISSPGASAPAATSIWAPVSAPSTPIRSITATAGPERRRFRLRFECLVVAMGGPASPILRNGGGERLLLFPPTGKPQETGFPGICGQYSQVTDSASPWLHRPRTRTASTPYPP